MDGSSQGLIFCMKIALLLSITVVTNWLVMLANSQIVVHSCNDLSFHVYPDQF